MARRVFYSFHYKPDCWRASTVRSIGAIEGNRAATDNDWESITAGGDAAIKSWIADQMYGRSCAVVLVGTDTANRKWINHEIVTAWNAGMGVVGVRIQGLKNADGETSAVGRNPFDFIAFEGSKSLSEIVKCYNPGGSSSRERYAWIQIHLANAVEEAIRIRQKY